MFFTTEGAEEVEPGKKKFGSKIRRPSSSAASVLFVILT
jgi:hypothetical protein